MDTLNEKVIALIAEETGRSEASIGINDKIEDLADDSICLFSIVTRFEKEFGMRAKYEDLIHIETVGDIVSYLQRHSPGS